MKMKLFGSVTPSVVAADVQEICRAVNRLMSTGGSSQMNRWTSIVVWLLFSIWEGQKWWIRRWIMSRESLSQLISDYLLGACPLEISVGIRAELPWSPFMVSSVTPHLSVVILWICIGGISCQTPSGSELSNTLRRCQVGNLWPGVQKGGTVSHNNCHILQFMSWSLWDSSGFYFMKTMLWKFNFTCQTCFIWEDLSVSQFVQVHCGKCRPTPTRDKDTRQFLRFN